MARWYDSEIGHFIQADSVVPGPGNPLAWNRYGYSFYSPLRLTDPDGHWPNTTNTLYTDAGHPSWWPKIVSRDEWGAAEPGSVDVAEGTTSEGIYSETNTTGYMKYTKPLRDVYDTAVFHHIYPADSSSSPDDIQSSEMADGYFDIAYAFLIGEDGTIYEGRDISYRGAAVAASPDPITGNPIGNTGRISIAFIGDFTTEYPTYEQELAALNLLRFLNDIYGIDYVYGHNDLNATECPGQNAYDLIDRLEGALK